jgi:hypothetical protein
MSLADPVSLAGGRVEHDLQDFLTTLAAADLLQITWRESGLQKGMDVFIPPLCLNPQHAVDRRPRPQGSVRPARREDQDRQRKLPRRVPRDARVCGARLCRRALTSTGAAAVCPELDIAARRNGRARRRGMLRARFRGKRRAAEFGGRSRADRKYVRRILIFLIYSCAMWARAGGKNWRSSLQGGP